MNYSFLNEASERMKKRVRGYAKKLLKKKLDGYDMVYMYEMGVNADDQLRAYIWFKGELQNGIRMVRFGELTKRTQDLDKIQIAVEGRFDVAAILHGSIKALK